MKNDTISIVVPIYNVENYLEECIDSLISQTYSNLEILLIDDGSTDNSGKIADDYMKKDERIKVFHKKNGGLSDARNYGIIRAKGKYICFIDSDDYVNKHFVSKLYQLITKENSIVSVIGYQKFTNESEITDYAQEEKNITVFTKEDGLNQLFKTDGFGNYAWNKLYLKELFDDVKYPINKKMEDLGTTYKILMKCDKIPYQPSQYYYYYQREGSILHTFDKKLYLDKLEQALERHSDIKIAFPNNIDNDIYIVNVILECMPYIYEKRELLNKSKNILKKTLNKQIQSRLSFNKKIKLLIYKININLYVKIFGGKNKNV